MKEKLRALLTAKYANGKSTSKYRGYSSKDYVKPRNLHWEKDDDSYSPSPYGKLVWTYVNDGDYTQNGVVAISDITPLAVHVILEGQGRQVDGENTILELIDEDGKEDDGDGYVDFNEELEYDGINDATADDLDTIVWNFGVDVAKYQVWGTDTPEDPESWDLVDEVWFEDRIAISGMRHEFEYVLANGDYRYYKVKPLSCDGEPWHHDPDLEFEVWSDIWQMAAPVITQVGPPPPQGDEGARTLFWVNTGNSPGTLSYEWDFQGHATIVSQSGNGVTVDLGETGGPWTCYVTVTNPYGSTQEEFQLQISYGAPFIRVDSISPTEGDEWEQDFEIQAIITGTLPIEYTWNFGGGATPNEFNGTITSGDHVARAKVDLLGPGVYDCTLSAHNNLYTSEDFQLMVGSPPVINSISPTNAMSGDLVEFSADVSGSAPLTYEWTFPDSWTPTSSNDPSPQVTVGRGGSIISPGALYYVTLKVTNPLGEECAATKTIEFYVDAQWHVQLVDQAISAEEGMKATSLELFADDRPGIAYEKTGELWFAEWNGGNWVLTPVDQNAQADVGAYASHEVDGAGDVHVAYFDETNGYLMYAARLSGGWRNGRRASLRSWWGNP
ncbi:hypothetical protein J7J84_07800, partial [bacterium]|nr:hypothetical protein [bacterium]